MNFHVFDTGHCCFILLAGFQVRQGQVTGWACIEYFTLFFFKRHLAFYVLGHIACALRFYPISLQFTESVCPYNVHIDLASFVVSH